MGRAVRPPEDPIPSPAPATVLTQGEGSGAQGEAIESHAVWRDALIQVQQ